MKKAIFTPILILALIFIGCEKKEEIVEPSPITNPDPDPDPKPEEPETITYSSDYPSNLNVVYFVPSDKEPLENYQKRISGIMLHTQEWFKKEMNRNGYGDKTFGMLLDDKDENSIKIIIVNGENTADHYPYSGGGSRARLEIDQYFNNNPLENASDHTVVFMPSRDGHNGWDAGGVPFYGIGKWCYVLDYRNFDMETWRDGSREGAESWIGGTIHEVGHALNLPHNKQKVNDGWISMLSDGNHVYNKNPDNVHLTKASATILNNNQVFNKASRSEFYKEVFLILLKQ